MRNIVDDARRVMDENMDIARFNNVLNSIEKIKEKYEFLNKNNERLEQTNIFLQNIVYALEKRNNELNEQISFLEEIINNMRIIVSIKDIKRRNLLWYNKNYQKILGYHHRELQELNCEEAVNHYHPDDYKMIQERDNIVRNIHSNSYSCVVRLKHVNGKWLKMRSDFYVLKRNSDGTASQAMEVMRAIEE